MIKSFVVKYLYILKKIFFIQDKMQYSPIVNHYIKNKYKMIIYLCKKF